ncbi:hypothetical protein GGQ79_004704 [Ochrobactrum pecoris]|uniref:Uncharacterized protein n=1 Tax=Brucella pecoris TaxID=867683 RepID=A0AB34YXS3_9HYPH|nr:hypothetical protein [Brucella pecoris]
MFRLLTGSLIIPMFCAQELSAYAADILVKNDLSACVALNVGEVRTWP